MPTLRSKCFRDLKFVFLSEVANTSFCLKFSGLIRKLKILEKSYLYYKSRNIQRTDLYFGLFLKLTKFMVHQWSLPNYFASKTQKILLHYYFSWRHAMKNSSGQMRQISRRMKMIHPTIGWRPDEHGTHKHAHGSWILLSVSRVRSKTMHSLHYIMAALHYSMLHRFETFSAPGTTAHGSISCRLAALVIVIGYLTLATKLCIVIGKIDNFRSLLNTLLLFQKVQKYYLI